MSARLFLSLILLLSGCKSTNQFVTAVDTLINEMSQEIKTEEIGAATNGTENQINNRPEQTSPKVQGDEPKTNFKNFAVNQAPSKGGHSEIDKEPEVQINNNMPSEEKTTICEEISAGNKEAIIVGLKNGINCEKSAEELNNSKSVPYPHQSDVEHSEIELCREVKAGDFTSIKLALSKGLKC